jgi:hypothetical protein
MLERSSFYLTGALREGETNKRACIPPAERGLSLAKLEVLTSFTRSVQSSSSMELYPSRGFRGALMGRKSPVRHDTRRHDRENEEDVQRISANAV